MPGANIVAACLAKRVGQPSPVILAGYTKSGHSKPALNASLLAIVDPPGTSKNDRFSFFFFLLNTHTKYRFRKSI